MTEKYEVAPAHSHPEIKELTAVIVELKLEVAALRDQNKAIQDQIDLLVVHVFG